ncbi:class I SAM-dependent methyltransferase [Sedimentisphaera salicampi]|uniref:Putative S-adenosylmethionine-dependent methyltransferase n=1 Tax=Sedimentisphaera salicampi TaxID=1941349 RepID=A0A1W6LM58_9BACT|nr:methyltransferase domain-containing protein [Sedimentisphaera salicampi]ARN56836.1 putative S-adenosylmethionine-dependent methyltransferase [Sedimentisphaera salicampi]
MKIAFAKFKRALKKISRQLRLASKEDIREINQKLDRIIYCTNCVFRHQAGLSITDSDFQLERQIVFRPEEAPKSQLTRYMFAKKIVEKNDSILDCACGVGYGSFILAEKVKIVLGVDLSEGSIEWANRFFKRDNNDFKQGDASVFKWPERFDKIVSFETIEHLEDDKKLIKNFYNHLEDGGTLICSVPNQNIRPWSRDVNKYHFRHYTTEDIRNLLETCGFKVVDILYQYPGDKIEKKQGKEGKTIVCIAKKK